MIEATCSLDSSIKHLRSEFGRSEFSSLVGQLCNVGTVLQALGDLPEEHDIKTVFLLTRESICDDMRRYLQNRCLLKLL